MNYVWLFQGAIAIAGACVRWLRDNLGIIKTSEEIGEQYVDHYLNKTMSVTIIC